MFSSEWRISPAHRQTFPNISLWRRLAHARSKRAERWLGLAARYLTMARRMFSASARFSSARLVMLRTLRPEMSSSGVGHAKLAAASFQVTEELNGKGFHIVYDRLIVLIISFTLLFFNLFLIKRTLRHFVERFSGSGCQGDREKLVPRFGPFAGDGD